MSIMDLHLTKRRSGGAGITAPEPAASASKSASAGGGKSVNLGSVSTAVPLTSHGGGQSYELIKSTQVRPSVPFISPFQFAFR